MIRRPPRSTLFPSRRSSDLVSLGPDPAYEEESLGKVDLELAEVACVRPRDRKSTRLNSSHVSISYAVFCLKKKKINIRSLALLVIVHLPRLLLIPRYCTFYP